MAISRLELLRVLGMLLIPACGGATPPPASPAPASETNAPPARPVRGSSPVAQKDSDADATPESIVQVSLEPLVTGVRPGGHFRIAAHFRIAPGYRISWKYPGEVGTATTVTFRAPPGFVVGPTAFPAPERYTAQGNYTGYGYQNETAVFADVTAKAGLRSDDVSRFDIDASWVACKKECTTERTSAFVELTTSYGSARADDVEAALGPFLARVPKPLADLPDAEQKWELGGRNAALGVTIPGATFRDFFPDGTGDPLPTKTSVADSEVRFTYDEAPHAGSRPLRGVIAANANGKDVFYDFEASLPGQEHPAAAPPVVKEAALTDARLYTKKSGASSLPGVQA